MFGQLFYLNVLCQCLVTPIGKEIFIANNRLMIIWKFWWRKNRLSSVNFNHLVYFDFLFRFDLLIYDCSLPEVFYLFNWSIEKTVRVQ